MRKPPIDRLMQAVEEFGVAMSNAGYTQGYRSREKPYGSQEERRLYEKEMRQWEAVEAVRQRLRRAIKRALRKAAAEAPHDA